MPPRPVVIVSNRGPVSFSLGADGSLEQGRGGGGLVTGLKSLGDSGAMWFASAISDGDVLAGDRGSVEVDGFDLHLLAVEPSRYEGAYDVIANETLWFLHHGLWDLSREPRFDDAWRAAWLDYRAMNQQFADAVVAQAPADAVVLVQDYHFALVGRMVASERSDVRLVHFHHTPFADAAGCSVLPIEVADELLDGLTGYHACGFHTEDWASNFIDAAGPKRDARTFVAPLAVDRDTLLAEAHTPECDRALTELDELIGDRRFLVRVDRIELSKNLLRGFQAFDLLLARRPEWRGRVVFGAFCYPSREGVEAYAVYRAEFEGLVREVNDRWGTADWTPIVLDSDDDYARSLAAQRRADVMLVNPVRDGLNLVADESTIVNERDAGLVLSDRAGVWHQLRDAADSVNPFDVGATATALDVALRRDADARRVQMARRREIVESRTPADWLADQLRAAGD
jgi:trehalose 6-phosphate synthase